MEKRAVCYIAATELPETAGAGAVYNSDFFTVEIGKRFPADTDRKKLLAAAVEKILPLLEGLKESNVIPNEFEVLANPKDIEIVRELLPDWLVERLSACNYNPAEQIAAEYAIGERN